MSDVTSTTPKASVTEDLFPEICCWIDEAETAPYTREWFQSCFDATAELARDYCERIEFLADEKLDENGEEKLYEEMERMKVNSGLGCV